MGKLNLRRDKITCIVGLEHKGKVIIGGDVQGTGGNTKILHTQPKVFNKKGVLMGYTSSYRFGQILEHNLADPVVPENINEVYRWLITVLVPDIKRALKDHNYGKDDSGGNALIGVRGQLWELQPDFSVLRSVLGYNAVGSGEEYAKASVYTSTANFGGFATLDAARSAVELAIATAGNFSPSVGTEAVLLVA